MLSSDELALGPSLPSFDEVSPKQTTRQRPSTITTQPTMAPDMERVVEFLGDPFEPRADPDAQTTVTDFIDFTEYLSADMTRSLTLIGDLDQRYRDASAKVNDYALAWGQRPSHSTTDRTSAADIRAGISKQLKYSVESRVFAHAEAQRMADNVHRHYSKAKILLDKLQTMMDNYPAEAANAEPRSPQLSRAKPASRPGADGATKPKQKRIPKITVPGEVLAPYEIEYDFFSDDSESSSDSDSDARRTPAPRIKLLTSHVRKPVNRPPRVMTYTSAAMAAAVAANAAALQNPPPENAVIGSADAPWLQLTLYELAKLRKRMKKNATWTPSETMIARELMALNRGPEAYREAKKKAEDEGKVFDAQVPTLITDAESGQQHLPAGAISADCLTGEGLPISNRGMKLNEAKKLKREAMKLAEESGIMPDIKMTPKSNSRPQGKRKRDNDSDAFTVATPAAAETPSARQQAKRTKVETPVPPPRHPGFNYTSPTNGGTRAPAASTSATPAAQQTPVPIPVLFSKSGTSPSGANGGKTVTTSIPIKPPAETPVPLPKTERTITPVFPPGRDGNPDPGKLQVVPTSSAGADDEPRSRRSLSRGVTPGAESKRPGSRGKAGSQEPPSLASDRPRRTSAARITPIPETKTLVKRPKRAAPGVVSRTSSGGNSAVGKRKAAPKKKKKSRAARGEQDSTQTSEDDEMEEIEVDDEGNVIDPNEERYCLCNGVSFGTMIQCNVDVSLK